MLSVVATGYHLAMNAGDDPSTKLLPAWRFWLAVVWTALGIAYLLLGLFGRVGDPFQIVIGAVWTALGILQIVLLARLRSKGRRERGASK